MSKRILIISTSLRKNSNSDALADAFFRGAEAAGHRVEKITLRGKTIGFCRGCMACRKLNRCVIQDDANAITEQISAADVVVFATPIYYYEMAAQMKAVLDRCNPLYETDYAFRDVYLLTAAAEDEDEVMDGAVKGLSGWVACFPEARLAGTLFAGGVHDPGAIDGHPALARAYEMGRNA